jgi:hypothetical protein
MSGDCNALPSVSPTALRTRTGCWPGVFSWRGCPEAQSCTEKMGEGSTGHKPVGAQCDNLMPPYVGTRGTSGCNKGWSARAAGRRVSTCSRHDESNGLRHHQQQDTRPWPSRLLRTRSLDSAVLEATRVETLVNLPLGRCTALAALGVIAGPRGVAGFLARAERSLSVLPRKFGLIVRRMPELGPDGRRARGRSPGSSER